ncbi:DUF7096 domain-containing protein [Halosimplex sp. J119]
MPRNRPVLLALVVAVLVLAPVTHSVAATTAPPTSVASPTGSSPETAAPLSPATADAFAASATASVGQNTSNYLEIREEAVEQTGRERTSLNVAGAVQQDVASLRSEYASLTFEQRYENTTGQTARLDVIRSEISQIERDVQQLELRRNSLLDDYNAGEMSTETFLRELAALDAAARDIESRIERVRQAAGLELPSDLDTKMDNVEGDLLTLRGPVRQRMSQAMTGDRGPVPVYTVTSPTGIVLASNQGSRYYREAYLGQNREKVGTDYFVNSDDSTGLSAANNRATELYPWVYQNNRGTMSVDVIGTTSIYYIRTGHPHGSLDTYLDGRTESAFREFQTKRIDALPTRSTTNATDDVVLQVNRTHATGPMELLVTDNETGQPLDASVTINGAEVGSTGSDGRLLTLAPHQAVRISVTTEDGRTVTERFFAN